MKRWTGRNTCAVLAVVIYALLLSMNDKRVVASIHRFPDSLRRLPTWGFSRSCISEWQRNDNPSAFFEKEFKLTHSLTSSEPSLGLATGAAMCTVYSMQTLRRVTTWNWKADAAT